MSGARIGTRLAVWAGVVLVLGTGVAPVRAAPQTSFSRSPDRGPRGTVVKVSGSGCTDGGQPWEYAYVYFASVSTEPGKKYSKASAHFPIHDDGSWEGEFTVPAEAPLGDYTVLGSCSASDMDRECGRAPFTVADVAPPTTTTTAPRPSSTTTASTTTTAKRPSRTTTTASTTTTTEAVPPPTAPPDDDDRATAARAAADRPAGDGGGPASALALLAVLPAGVGGALALRRLRRR